jgi:two-component system response regulator MprA
MRARVLFVDDEPLNRRLVPLQLDPKVFEVVVCETGLEGLAALSRERFDLVILDVMMPPPDGVETCRRMRASGYVGPILFMSGWPDAETQARAFDAGGDAFLPRPYRRDELRAVIGRLLGPVSATA